MNWKIFINNYTLIYQANGLLITCCFLWSQGPLLLATVFAATVLLAYDCQVRWIVGDRVRRYRRSRQTHASHCLHWKTGAAIGLWLLASLSSAPPTSFIGALMWLAFVVALWLIPQKRESLLFRQKMMLAVYALIAQRFAINRGSLLRPRRTTEDHIRDLRTRSEGYGQ